MAYTYTGDVDLYGVIPKVGVTGIGTLTIYAGSETAERFTIGDTATGIGTINVNNNAFLDIIDDPADPQFLDDNRMIVGHYGTGTLNITGGGDVAIYGGDYNGLLVGNKAGSVGTVLVSGTGSALGVDDSAANLRIGNYGTGTLNIENGGYVDSLQLDVGRESGSVGTVNIDGIGSELVLNNLYGRSYPNFVGEAAFGQIGRESGSSGYLNITNGGLFEISNLDGVTDNPAFQIARNDGSYSKAVVDGLGSELSIIQNGVNGNSYGAFTNLQIGRNGQGILDITNQGSVSVTGDQASAAVGRAGGGDNSVDPASQLNIRSGGDMLIDSQTFSGARLDIGPNTNSRADVLVTGSGSTLTVNGDYAELTVGRFDGYGSLTVTAGAVVTVSGNEADLYIGRGNNAGLTNAESQLYVTNGGVVNVTSSGNDYGAFAILGGYSDGNGYAQVDGAGSQLNISSNNNGSYADDGAFMDVGEYGEGTLYVTNGGAVNISGGTNDGFVGIVTAYGASSYGRTSVSGFGGADSSRITVTGTNGTTGGSVGIVAVGAYSGSDGGLTISSGGQVINDQLAGFTAVGLRAGSTGYITVNGMGGSYTTLLDGGELMIVGADFAFDTADFSAVANTVSSVNYLTGGTGTVTSLGDGIVRADEIVVGDGGRLDGDSTFDGNVTVDGSGYGTIAPGGTGRTLAITGDLDLVDGTLEMDIDGLTAGQFDKIDVTGAVTLNNGDIQIAIGGTYTPTTGDTLVILSGAGGITFAAENFDLSASGSTLAFQIGDTGTDLQFKALNDGSGTAIIDFGTASTTAASATIIGTEGYGTGGNFDTVAFIGATQLDGTTVDDNFDASAATTGLTLKGFGGSDTLIGGAGNDTLTGGLGDDVLNGGTGTDTVSFADDTQGVIVTASAATGAGIGNDTLIQIENVIGGSALDHITGGAVNNTLSGGGGNDTLIGGAGDDVLIGGMGFDTASFVGDSQGVSVTAIAAIGAGSGNDTLIQIENIIGGSGNDQIIGGAVNNVLNGGAGNDRIIGGAGNDKIFGDAGDDVLEGGAGNDNLTGGAGIDTISFAFDALGVTVTTNSATGAGIGSDGMLQIENITGGFGNDHITGGGVSNVLSGRGGDDILIGGGGGDVLDGGTGDDSLNGGTGFDTASFTAATAKVIVDLGAGTASGSQVGTDTLISIENATGGSGNDNLTGGGVNNVLKGGAGNDVLEGLGGNDTLEGGAGADTLDGGSGSDTASFASSTASVTVKLTAGTATGSQVGNDTLVSIENAAGGSGNDSLTGNGAANLLIGGDGNDTLFGAGGGDALFGQAGDDRLNGTQGNDNLFGGTGNDTFVYLTGYDADRVRDWEDGSDLVDLTSFGFTDFGEVLALSSQSGADVLVDFGGGDTLTIEDLALASFDATDVMI